MLTDVRLEKLAKNLVNYSCRVKKGEKVWIDFSGVDYQLGLHRGAGLTDLLGMGQHTSVNKRTGGCQLAP